MVGTIILDPITFFQIDAAPGFNFIPNMPNTTSPNIQHDQNCHGLHDLQFPMLDLKCDYTTF